MAKMEVPGEEIRKQIFDNHKKDILERYRQGKINSAKAMEELKKLSNWFNEKKDTPVQGTMFL